MNSGYLLKHVAVQRDGDADVKSLDRFEKDGVGLQKSPELLCSVERWSFIFGLGIQRIVKFEKR